MTNVVLLPRLSPIGVATVLREAGPKGPQLNQSASFLAEFRALVSYGPSGGTRVPSAVIIGIAKNLRNLATACGFPGASDAAGRASFDRKAAIALAGMKELQSGEALRDDVWAFLATILTCDVVAWRFPGLAPERFGGGNRNAFQRLWIRGRALDRDEEHPDRWKLVEELSEDAMVQIFERASIAANAGLARAIAEEWVRVASLGRRAMMEDVMRTAMKLIRLRNEIVDLSCLPGDELAAEIGSAFGAAIAFRDKA